MDTSMSPQQRVDAVRAVIKKEGITAKKACERLGINPFTYYGNVTVMGKTGKKLPKLPKATRPYRKRIKVLDIEPAPVAQSHRMMLFIGSRSELIGVIKDLG